LAPLPYQIDEHVKSDSQGRGDEAWHHIDQDEARSHVAGHTGDEDPHGSTVVTAIALRLRI
jgi:hypothetical protein